MPNTNRFLQINLILKYGFFNKSASINLFLLLFMNIFYSIAPIFLGISLSSTDNHTLIFYVVLYLLFNYFPYLTEAVRSVYITKWKTHAQEQISSVILNNLSRNYLLLNDHAIKTNKPSPYLPVIRRKSLLSNDRIYACFGAFAVSLSVYADFCDDLFNELYHL